MLGGIEVWSASPLVLYQLRVGIAREGSFGPLSDQQRESTRLRERFFPDRSEADLEPATERLPTADR